MDVGADYSLIVPIETVPSQEMDHGMEVVGPFDEILIPRNSRKTDWEVELGVVIGKTARYLD